MNSKIIQFPTTFVVVSYILSFLHIVFFFTGVKQKQQQKQQQQQQQQQEQHRYTKKKLKFQKKIKINK